MIERYSGTRRAFLATSATLFAGLAGCAGANQAESTTSTSTLTETTTKTTDDPGTGESSTTTQESKSPSIEVFKAQIPSFSGELKVHIEGRDDGKISSARVSTSIDEISKEPDAEDFEFTQSIEGRPGKVNQIEATVTDGTGNQTNDSIESYVRNHDVFEVTPLDLSAVYIPFTGDKFHKCLIRTEPAVGQYGDPIPPEVTTRHIDQMQGHGVTTVAFNFGEESQDYERWRTFTESSLSEKVNVEAYYVLSQALRRGHQIDEYLGFIRENMFSRDNYNTIDGRPVVQFWGVAYPAWAGNDEAKAAKEEIMDEYGGFVEFVEHIRSELTLEGTDPFLIGEFRNNGLNGGVNEKYQDYFAQFDAGSTWTGILRPGETVAWDTSFESTRKNFEAIRAFTDEHDMEFVPTVYPGFNDTHNSCWGGDRHTPRSPDHLAQLLKLADQYRTLDKVNIASWNGWSEGHQIEPGMFQRSEYGTDYLNVVREFQKGKKC